MNTTCNLLSLKEKFEARIFQNQNKEMLRYRLYKPANYNRQKNYPLLIFLHGSEQRGADNEAQLTQGLGILVENIIAKNYECIIVAPQCPEYERWANLEWDQTNHEQPHELARPSHLVMQLVNDFILKGKVDPARIYLTGISMGGFGVWDIISRFPETFAAAIPVCGGGDKNTAISIKELPLWVFHGEQDNIVDVECSRKMIKALQNSGASPNYTEFKATGHECWSQAFSYAGLVEWLFEQKNNKKLEKKRA